MYGIPVITHSCLEPHGLRHPVAGRPGDGVALHAVRHRVGRHAGAQPQGPGRQHQGEDGLHRRRLRQQVQPGSLGRESAPDSLAEGGRQAGQDLPGSRQPNRQIAGNRPSAFGKIKVAGKKDGTITAWQIRHLGQRRLRGRRPASPAVRLHQHPQHAPQSHLGLRQRRTEPGVARAQQSAGVVPHLFRHRGFRRQGRLDPMDGLRQERRLHAARRTVSLSTGQRPPSSPNGRSSGSRAARKPARSAAVSGLASMPGAATATPVRPALRSTPMARCCSKWARRTWAPARAPS